MRNAVFIMLVALILASAPAIADSSANLDCYFKVDGKRVIDGPCNVQRSSDSELGHTYNLQVTSLDEYKKMEWFFNIRVTDFSTTISWNGLVHERRDLISFGNTFRKPNSDTSLPNKCRSNNVVEICIWDQNDRPLSMKNINLPWMFSSYRFNWNDHIPHFNVNENCAIISPGNYRLKDCIEKEQESYDNLKSVWNELSDNNRQTCAHVANKRPWENYQVLANCVSANMSKEKREEPIPSFHE